MFIDGALKTGERGVSNVSPSSGALRSYSDERAHARNVSFSKLATAVIYPYQLHVDN